MITKEYELTVYSSGLVYCSVCTNAPKSEVAPTVNEHNPTGIDGGWQIADEPFADGSANPHPCENNPKTHKHYLMEC